MPAPTPLTSERLVRHGLYLMEDGQSIFLWIGRDAVPQLVQDVFDVPRYDMLQSGKASNKGINSFQISDVFAPTDHSTRLGQRL